jgi:hypothetical protein
LLKSIFVFFQAAEANDHSTAEAKEPDVSSKEEEAMETDAKDQPEAEEKKAEAVEEEAKAEDHHEVTAPTEDGKVEAEPESTPAAPAAAEN